MDNYEFKKMLFINIIIVLIFVLLNVFFNLPINTTIEFICLSINISCLIMIIKMEATFKELDEKEPTEIEKEVGNKLYEALNYNELPKVQKELEKFNRGERCL